MAVSCVAHGPTSSSEQGLESQGSEYGQQGHLGVRTKWGLLLPQSLLKAPMPPP